MTSAKKSYTLFETVDKRSPPGGITVIVSVPSGWAEISVDGAGGPTFLAPGMSAAARDLVTLATFPRRRNASGTSLDDVASVQDGYGEDSFTDERLDGERRWLVQDIVLGNGVRRVHGRLMALHEPTGFVVSCAVVLHGDATRLLREARALCESLTM